MNLKFNRALDHVLYAVSCLGITAGIYLAFIYSSIAKDPDTGAVLPIQKIIYFHVPGAWVSFLAFFIVAAASVMLLRTGEKKWDTYAASAAEIGVYYCVITLITGPIWGHQAWGTWWNWQDPKLDTYLLLWALYVGYLILRRSIDEESRRGRYSAVYGIVAFVDVPIVFFSVQFISSYLHPEQIILKSAGLAPDMKLAFFVSLFAFTILFFLLFFRRIHLSFLEEELEDLKKKIGG